MHSLWLRCPHGRSGQWKRAGLPVAECVLPAELRGDINNPGISLSDQHRGKVFHLLSLVLFLDYFQGKKNLEVDFWIEGEKNLVSDCLQLPLSISSSAAETAQIDLV